MPETGAFKDDIKADSEVPTRAKKARKSGVFKDSIKHKYGPMSRFSTS